MVRCQSFLHISIFSLLISATIAFVPSNHPALIVPRHNHQSSRLFIFGNKDGPKVAQPKGSGTRAIGKSKITPKKITKAKTPPKQAAKKPFERAKTPSKQITKAKTPSKKITRSKTSSKQTIGGQLDLFKVRVLTLTVTFTLTAALLASLFLTPPKPAGGGTPAVKTPAAKVVPAPKKEKVKAAKKEKVQVPEGEQGRKVTRAEEKAYAEAAAIKAERDRIADEEYYAQKAAEDQAAAEQVAIEEAGAAKAASKSLKKATVAKPETPTRFRRPSTVRTTAVKKVVPVAKAKSAAVEGKTTPARLSQTKGLGVADKPGSNPGGKVMAPPPPISEETLAYIKQYNK